MGAATDLTIIQLNDSHAYLELHPELFWAGDRAAYRMLGGYARIGAVLDQVRQERAERVLAFDCGDTMHGTYAAVTTQGEAIVPVLNALSFDAMTAHWEFAYGPAQLKRLAGQLQYPVLAINCYDKPAGNLIFEPYIIREVGGLRIGAIGIASNIIDKTMPPSFAEGIHVTLGNVELRDYITKLRNDDKLNLIVVISHLGFPQDMKLAQEVGGIDVLLSGHTHNRLYRPALVDNTIVIQSGCHGSFLGSLDLKIQGKRIVDYHHQLIPITQEIKPDPEVQQLVDQALAPYREELRQVVGYTTTDLNRGTILEATMDNLLLLSLLEVTGAQMAFSNGWRYGAPILPGPVTLNDLWNIVPMNPFVSTCDLTGDEVWTMMEENLERTFASDPYDHMGGYVKRCLGINLYFKIENPKGHRIQELFVRGERVKLDKLYTAAFVTMQAVPAKYGARRKNLDVRAVEALQRYLAIGKSVEAQLRGTVVAV